MWRDFRLFLTRSNALALAVGVIIGAAVGSVVTALTTDILMPLISVILPSGDWRQSKFVLSRGVDTAGKVTENSVLYGHFFGVLVDFVVIAFVIFLITKAALRSAPPPPTKSCPRCLELVPAAATRCRACTAEL